MGIFRPLRGLKGRSAPFLYFRGSFGRFAAARALRALFVFQGFIRPLRGLKGRYAPFLYFRCSFGRFAAAKGASRPFCFSGVHSAASQPQRARRELFVFQGFIRPLRGRKGRSAPFLYFRALFGRFAASKGAPRPFCISGVHSAASRPQKALRALFVFQGFIRPLRGRKGRSAPFLYFRALFGRFAASKGAPRPFCISGVHSAASQPQRARRELFVFQGFIRPLRGRKGRSAPFLYFRALFGRFAASKGAPRPFCISGVHSAASRPQRALRALFVFQGFIRPLRGLRTGASRPFFNFLGNIRPLRGLRTGASRPFLNFLGNIRPLRGLRTGASRPFLIYWGTFGRFAASGRALRARFLILLRTFGRFAASGRALRGRFLIFWGTFGRFAASGRALRARFLIFWGTFGRFAASGRALRARFLIYWGTFGRFAASGRALLARFF
ncbi:hypothetical protein niasHS_009472 [Heterodera schachtii]|uniref:Uncharacterized protein n=1 Tax=Heterodera schachtii TaxID=97005 RepID=A0ABD2JBD7_HETSC